MPSWMTLFPWANNVAAWMAPYCNFCHHGK